MRFIGTEGNTMNFKTMVINLDRREDRYEQFLKVFTRNHERFSAYDGALLLKNEENLGEFETNLLNSLRSDRRNPPRHLNGVFGCWLSHYNLWEMLSKDENTDFYVIFEDDIKISSRFEEEYEKILENIDYSFDFYYLGGRFKENFVPMNKQPWKMKKINDYEFGYSVDKTSLNYDHDRGLFSYVITKSAANKLVNLVHSHIKNVGSIAAVDGWVNENRVFISTADVFPHLTWSPANFNSDIR